LGCGSAPQFFYLIMKLELVNRVKRYRRLNFTNREISKLTGVSLASVMIITKSVKIPKLSAAENYYRKLAKARLKKRKL